MRLQNISVNNDLQQFCKYFTEHSCLNHR